MRAEFGRLSRGWSLDKLNQLDRRMTRVQAWVERHVPLDPDEARSWAAMRESYEKMCAFRAEVRAQAKEGAAP